MVRNNPEFGVPRGMNRREEGGLGEVTGLMGWTVVQARRSTVMLIVVVLAGMLALVGCGVGQGTGEPEVSLPERLEEGGQHLDRAIAAMQADDMATVTLEYQDFSVIWMQIGDRIWERSRDSHIAIQNAIDNVDRELLRPGVTPDKDRTVQAFQELRQVVKEQAAKLGP